MASRNSPDDTVTCSNIGCTRELKAKFQHWDVSDMEECYCAKHCGQRCGYTDAGCSTDIARDCTVGLNPVCEYHCRVSPTRCDECSEAAFQKFVARYANLAFSSWFLFGSEFDPNSPLPEPDEDECDFGEGMGFKKLLGQGQAAPSTAEMKPPFEPFIKLSKAYKLDDFKSPSSVGGGQKMPSGAVQMPYVVLTPPQEAFYAAAATWTSPFDWMKWSESGKGKALVKGEPGSIEKASAEELQKLLTAWIRSDRFCEGAFAGFCEQGLAGRVLQRIQLLEERSRGSK